MEGNDEMVNRFSKEDGIAAYNKINNFIEASTKDLTPDQVVVFITMLLERSIFGYANILIISEPSFKDKTNIEFTDDLVSDVSEITKLVSNNIWKIKDRILNDISEGE